MTMLIIFGAKYLIALSVLLTLYALASEHRGRHAKMIAHLCFALPLAYGIAVVSRILYFNPRPFAVEHFTPLIPHGVDNGFPSDHTLLAAALAAAVTAYNPRLGAILWMIAIIVGISRVAAGVHHPIDIIGSLVIASAAALAVQYILRFHARTRSTS